MQTRLLITLVIIAFFLGGCAATYAPPKTPGQNAEMKIDKPRSDLFKAARRALVADGYQIASADEQSGTISTASKSLKVTPEQANCGTTLGIDYLKDNRTSTRVAYGLIVDDGRIQATSTIEGEYKPGAVDQNITLTCISRGVLEQSLLDKIRATL